MSTAGAGRGAGGHPKPPGLYPGPNPQFKKATSPLREGGPSPPTAPRPRDPENQLCTLNLKRKLAPPPLHTHTPLNTARPATHAAESLAISQCARVTASLRLSSLVKTMSNV